MAMMRPIASEAGGDRVVNITGGNTNLNMDADPTSKKKLSVQVKLELGHKAITRKKPTPEGFTHDWTMFVRGPEGSNIQHFVDRVIFLLHDSFPKPRRVVKEPPYQINESGYAGFNLPIEIYFKNKDEPKRINFSYDLFLHTPHSPPVNHVRCEKLTFQNPSEEFRRKLIKAGGMAILGQPDTSQPGSSQTASPTPSLTLTQPRTPDSKAYTDLFGAPSKPPEIPASSSSSKKHKSTSKDKSGARSKSSSSSQGSSISPLSGSLTGTPPTTATPPSTPLKEQKSHTSSSSSSSKHTKEKSGKRAAETASQPESSKKKRKDTEAAEQRSKEREEKRERAKQEKEKQREKEKERKKEKKSSSRESKSKHKSSKKETTKKEKSDAKSPRGSTKSASPPAAAAPAPVELPPAQDMRTLAAKKAPPPLLDDFGLVGEFGTFDDDLDLNNMGITPEIMAAVGSPASTLSFSSMKGQGSGEGGGGPLGALLAEMDDDDVPLSPLPTTSDSPPPSRTAPPPSEKEPVREPPTKTSPPPAPEPTKTTIAKAKKKDKEKKGRNDRRAKDSAKENKEASKENTNVTKSNTKDDIAKDLFADFDENNKDSEVDKSSSAISKSAPTNLDTSDLNGSSQGLQQAGAMIAPNGEALSVLLELQARLMKMTDRDLVQRVVNVIEETGMYKISDATFDFDLCSLDINTVKKLQVCLEMVC